MSDNSSDQTRCKQTVYAHFSNKEELFRACINAKIASLFFERDRRR